MIKVSMNKNKYKSNNRKNNNILYRGTERTSIWTVLSVSILVGWIKNRFIVIDNEKQMILLLLFFSVVTVLFCCFCSFLLCSVIFLNFDNVKVKWNVKAKCPCNFNVWEWIYLLSSNPSVTGIKEDILLNNDIYGWIDFAWWLMLKHKPATDEPGKMML